MSAAAGRPTEAGRRLLGLVSSRLVWLLVALAGASLSAAVNVEKVQYRGRSNAYRLTNGEVELIVTSDVGPRILRYGFVDGENLFKEMSPEEEGRLTAGQEWRLYGGHRIWVGPEEPHYTYAADNSPVAVDASGDELIAAAPVDVAGIQKQISVRLEPSGTGVTVRHRLVNKSRWPLRFAPWALTMMAPGGTAIALFPPRGTHPEHLAPSNPLVMWRFTNLSDPRWGFFEKYLTLRQDPERDHPEKLGLFRAPTVAAYLLDGDLFVKTFDPPATGDYPDMGSSFETFTNDLFLELETLGPVTEVQPDGFADHVETWRLHRGVRVEAWTEAELDRVIAPLLE